MIPLYKNGKKIHMTHLSAVVAFFTLRANLCRKQNFSALARLLEEYIAL